MKGPQVAILMGSDSDLELMAETGKVLKEFGVTFDIKVLSAHRSPAEVIKYVEQAKGRGTRVFICGAGGAAHLAGVVAAHTTLPVIGVPINATALDGMDALLSTVQMPAGIPVATVAIGKPGTRNAAYLACQILALSDAGMDRKMEEHKKKLSADVIRKNQELEKRLSSLL